MKLTNKQRSKKIKDAMRKIAKAKDMEEIKQIMDEAQLSEEDLTGDELDPNLMAEGENEVHIHLDSSNPAPGTNDDALNEFMAANAAEHDEFRSRIDALEQALAALTPKSADAEEMEVEPEMMMDEFPEGLEEEGVKAQDSRYLATSFRDTISMAEILAPGIQTPTFDTAANPKQTFKKICGLRRKALDQACETAPGSAIITELLGGRRLNTKRMTCDAVRTVFIAASKAMAGANNSAGIRQSVLDMQSPIQPANKVATISDLNKKLKDYYSNH